MKMQRNKVLVTGCLGFIGMHLCKKLIDFKIKVLGVDAIKDYYDVNLKMARLGVIRDNMNFQFLKLDLCDFESLDKSIKDFSPDVVVNLAAQAGVRYSLVNPNAYVQSNITGFLNVLQSCINNKIENLVYASSSSVYGLNNKIPFNTNDNVDKPISFYAVSKKSNELMAHTYSYLYGLKTIGLRFFTVYGPWGRPDMAYYIFCDKIAKGEEISVFNNGNMQRDFTYIDDVVDGIVSAIGKNYKYKIFNLGNNSSIDIMKMINLLESALGKKAIINFEPIQPGDVKKTYADIADSKKLLDYNPKITISEGISKFVDWYLSYN